MRQRVPDLKKAMSMLDAAEKDMRFILSLSVSLDSGQTIISRVYEDFRMLGDAFLLSQGKEAVGENHHEIMLEALFELPVKTERPLRALLSLKSLRHNINYRGYIPSLLEIEDAQSLAKVLFPILLKDLRPRFSKVSL